MLREQGSLASKVNGSVDLPDMEPDQVMEALREQMKADFPELSDVSYEIRSVHPSMEDFLSPAFLPDTASGYPKPQCDLHKPRAKSIQSGAFYHACSRGFPGICTRRFPLAAKTLLTSVISWIPAAMWRGRYLH